MENYILSGTINAKLFPPTFPLTLIREIMIELYFKFFDLSKIFLGVFPKILQNSFKGIVEKVYRP